jgi:hypothetical protein
VSVEGYEHSRPPSTSKRTENIERIRELNRENHRQTIHDLTDTSQIIYGACGEILTENLNWVLYHGSALSRMSLKTTELVTNNNMLIISHPPFLPDLVPCSFTLQN